MHLIAMKALVKQVESLIRASDSVVADAPDAAWLASIAERGLFRPGENDQLTFWFARYLSVREALWDLIQDVVTTGNKPPERAESTQDWQLLIIGYVAACTLIRIDRLFLFQIASRSVVQRKLNEAVVEYRIPRKQYTHIFSSFVDHKHAMLINEAIGVLNRERSKIAELQSDECVGELTRNLPLYESWLDKRKRNYVKRSAEYISHSLRRRGVVALTESVAQVMEGAGRTVSGVGGRRAKQIDQRTIHALSLLLQPGDILITRHDRVLTNLFLPGFWPHAALYIGTPAQREQWAMDINTDKRKKWVGNHAVLEALKDGVHCPRSGRDAECGSCDRATS